MTVLQCPSRMRFLLYNIRYGTGGKRGHSLWRYAASTRRHLPLIIRYIEDLNPDVIGLIEVDSGSYRSGGRNQAELISHALGHHHAYESKYHAESFTRWIPVLRRQGNAFIARDTIANARTHYFRKGVKRLVLELDLDQVSFFLVHLALGAQARHHQLGDLYELVKSSAKPRIVAGDFNTGRTAETLTKAGLVRATGARDSFAAEGTQAVDQVWVSPHLAIRRATMIDPGDLTDHQAWMVRLTLPGPG